MKNRKLTTDQIDDLFEFCREHYIYHYDIQLELVDHLASAIEQKWENNPKLTYEQALWGVFDSFGVYGFTKMRKAKEKALQKKYMLIQWKYISEFFRLPKINMTIAIALIFFTILRFTTNNIQTSLVLMTITFLFSLFYRHYLYPKKFKLQIIHGMSFMLADYQKTFYGFIVRVAYAPMNLFVIASLGRKAFNYSDFVNNPYFELGISFLITFFIIVMIVVSFYVPQRIKDDFIRDFPQFVKV